MHDGEKLNVQRAACTTLLSVEEYQKILVQEHEVYAHAVGIKYTSHASIFFLSGEVRNN